MCYSSCPTGSYYSAATCIECISPCFSCVNQNSCLSCVSGYYLYMSQCVLECPSTYFNNSNTNTCDPCEINCNECVDSSQCT